MVFFSSMTKEKIVAYLQVARCCWTECEFCFGLVRCQVYKVELLFQIHCSKSVFKVRISAAGLTWVYTYGHLCQFCFSSPVGMSEFPRPTTQPVCGMSSKIICYAAYSVASL